MEDKEQNILTEEFQVIHIEKNEKKKRKPLAEHSGKTHGHWSLGFHLPLFFTL